MKVSNAKLKAIILFFAHNTNKRYLGKVKLMKLMYFMDFKHVKNYGKPVTYDTYVKLDYGPVPSLIKNLVDDTAGGYETVLTDTISFESPKGTAMEKVIPKRQFTEADKKLFSPTELEVLSNVCARFKDATTKEIVDESHKEAPWKEVELYKEIPYTLAAHDKDCNVSEEAIDLLSNLV